MPEWGIWLIVAAGLVAGEVLTLGFVLGPIALAALLAAAAAALGLGTEIQLAAFAVAAVASVLVLRPLARSHLRTPARLRTGTAALVGSPATVLERVHEGGGQVRIGGEVWTARPYEDQGEFEPGARVEVLQIRGATALVAE
ncbi:MAG: NfeD family protein [Thermoleophilaceae bacterium]|jgi:membrane protein implicated in regulation of membrane protease activity